MAGDKRAREPEEILEELENQTRAEQILFFKKLKEDLLVLGDRALNNMDARIEELREQQRIEAAKPK